MTQMRDDDANGQGRDGGCKTGAQVKDERVGILQSLVLLEEPLLTS